MDSILKNEKIKMIVKLLAILAVVYVFIVYIIELVWPVVLGAVMALLMEPFIKFLSDRLGFGRTFAAILSLSVLIAVLTVGGFYFGKLLTVQVTKLSDNWNSITNEVDTQIYSFCNGIERGMHLEPERLYMTVSDGFEECLAGFKDKILKLIMNNSVPAVIKIIELLVAVLITIISAFYIARDGEEMRQNVQKSLFAREISMVAERVSHVFKAYLRAQLIIMLGTVVLCFVGLTIIKNPYSMLVAIALGAADALPMLGIGVVLVPWAIISLIWGNVKNSIVLAVVFVLCYILRQILEPRLIGDKVGMSPIMSLASIYAGYKIFGLVGVLAGPIAYIMIKESLKT